MVASRYGAKTSFLTAFAINVIASIVYPFNYLYSFFECYSNVENKIGIIAVTYGTKSYYDASADAANTLIAFSFTIEIPFYKN